MENTTAKLLESATHRTLHAHAFSRSSSQASLTLTDLLARYLTLLSNSCARYAQHSGRRRMSIYDVLEVLGDLGVNVNELNEYATGEAKELARYTISSGRRVEDLNELNAQIHHGLKADIDDAIPLVYAFCSDHDLNASYEESEGENAFELRSIEIDPTLSKSSFMDVDVPSLSQATPLHFRTSSLPLSSASTPPPTRKRPRLATWQPPDHIPNFLPPFPEVKIAVQETASSTSPPHLLQPTFDLPLPGPLHPEPPKVDKTNTTTVTSALTPDYLVQVPYSQSSISQIPEWHLPGLLLNPHTPVSRSSITRLSTPQTEPALFAAYHHILTHPPSQTAVQPTLIRHKVAMALLTQTQVAPRWDVTDTLYGGVTPCTPRMSSVGPTYPIALGSEGTIKEGIDKEKEFKFPPTIPRSVAYVERIAPLVSQQGSRIPDLARNVLPPTIHSRTSRLTHPPPLQRGAKLLVYGIGVPAPWNTNVLPSVDAPPSTPALGTKIKDNKATEEAPAKQTLPDARLYATWECDTKDFRIPPVSRSRGRMGSVAGVIGNSSGGGTITLGLGARGKNIGKA